MSIIKIVINCGMWLFWLIQQFFIIFFFKQTRHIVKVLKTMICCNKMTFDNVRSISSMFGSKI